MLVIDIGQNFVNICNTVLLDAHCAIFELHLQWGRLERKECIELDFTICILCTFNTLYPPAKLWRHADSIANC